jgi:hypothetical protein
MDWSKWLCRCSAIGTLMTEPKLVDDKKAGNLSATAKTYLKEVYAELKYGRREEFTSKYTDKGNATQKDCLTLLCRLDKKLYKENNERLSNAFITGIPDFYDGETIRNAQYLIENKSAWSIHTFLAWIGEEVDKGWAGQTQGYLALTNCKEGEVSVCLVDATPEMILEEKRKLLWKMADKAATDLNPEYLEACRELEHAMTFKDIPIEECRIRYPITRDDEFIESVYDKVKKGRLYLAEIESLHMNGRKPSAPAIDIKNIPLIKIK